MVRFLYSILLVCLIVGCKKEKTEKIGDDYLKDADFLTVKPIRDSALYYYYADEWVDAIRLFDYLILNDTINRGEYFYKRGYCQALIDNIHESTDDYKRAADEGYEISDSYYSIGLNYSILTQDSIAIVFYLKALSELDSLQDINPSDRADILDRIRESEKRLRVKQYSL